MHWAAALGHTEVIEILYKAKADINALNKVTKMLHFLTNEMSFSM